MDHSASLIQQLTLQGIRLWLAGEKLRYAGPPQRLTPDILATLKRHKADVVRYLSTTQLLPASYGQQGLWSIHQQTAEEGAYTVSLAFEITGPLNVTLLRDVFQLLVARHEALRTRLVWQDGQVWQQVDGHQRAFIEEFAAPDWDAEERQRQLTALHVRPFDLAQGPLLRTTIIQHGPQACTLLISAHHAIVDGWSSFQLLDELWCFYESLAAGRTVPLAPVSHTYADYVAWQQQMLAQNEERLWAFWRDQVGDDYPILALPSDFARPPVRSLRGVHHAFRLSSELTTRLKGVAQTQQVTLYVLLLASYQLLLQRHTGQPALMVGLPMAGRMSAAFGETIGYLTSPVVLRSEVDSTLSLAELLAQVKARTLAALDHQDYPFARLVERLNPPRDPSRPLLFQSNFVLQRPHRSQALLQTASGQQVSDLHVRMLPLPLFAGQEDIALELLETDTGLEGIFKGSADLFTSATLARMSQRWEVLLEAIAGDPQRSLATPLAALPILTPTERQQLLVEWNNTSAPFPQDRCIHHLIAAQAARTPDAIA
ncbi:MAG: hypothetical protein EI684_00600, partial [Candidatus Viridilinea halotolerans]